MKDHKDKTNLDKKIFIISGLCDIQVSGNQIMKNTIKYISEFYRVFVFTFLPKGYPNLENPAAIFKNNVTFYRMPYFLNLFFYFGRKIKNFLGKIKFNSKSNIKHLQTIDVSSSVEYFDDYNIFGRILYITFLLFYLPMELLRVIFYYFKYKPDLFYGYEIQGAILASFLGRLFKLPVVNRFQGTALKLSYLSNLKDKLLYIDNILAMTSPCDAIIMDNDGTCGDKVLEYLGVDSKKIYFWMNGLDIEDLSLEDDFNPREFRKSLNLDNRKIILMVSKLKIWKRVDRGIYCIYKLVKSYKMKDIILLIIGGGPEEARLKSLAESLGIKDYIRFLGSQPHSNVKKYYAISDIFLNLFDISNLGNPTIEALYFGLPIVTINDGSTLGLLQDSYNSFLVNREGIEFELPEKVKILLEDQDLRKRMGNNAKITFNERCFSWEERMKLEINLLQKLLLEKL